MYRDHTKVVKIGNRVIGGGNPILIQSMTNTKTEDVKATVEQIHRLTEAGCEIIRCTVPTKEAAEAIKEIKKQITIPLVADIHFDYKMAIAAMENGADKIRINPGNIGSLRRQNGAGSAGGEKPAGLLLPAPHGAGGYRLPCHSAPASAGLRHGRGHQIRLHR